jgi:hypothetical protein
MRKLLFCAALCILTFAGDAGAMTYSLVTLPDGNCIGPCPHAVVARGKIEGNETARLLAVLQQFGQTGEAPRSLIVSSPGGDLTSALDLGFTLRRLGTRIVVGSVARRPDGNAVLTSGICGSACVFVMMAGVDRFVVPGSRVAVHSPQVVVVGQDRSYLLDGAMSQYLVRGAEPALQAYARQMGVDPAVIALADRIPNQAVRTLTWSELTRFRLVTGGEPRRQAGPAPWRPHHRAAHGSRHNAMPATGV